MTKNFLTRALLVAGFVSITAVSAFAQGQSTVRRVGVGHEDLQPVATSSVALTAPSMNLSASQRTQLVALNNEVASLQNERAQLWSDYKTVISRPNFDDKMAAAEAAPRMLRIVALNTQLSQIVATQEPKVNAILSSTQRDLAAKALSGARVQLAAASRTGRGNVSSN